MKTAEVTLIEIGLSDIESLTLKAANAICNAKLILHDVGVSSEILNISSKASFKKISDNDKCESILKEILKANQEGLVILFSHGSFLKEVIKRHVRSELTIIPSLKPFLAHPGQKKISITKRGTNTSFMVINERMGTNQMISHLQFAAKTSCSILIQNNFTLLPDIIEFLRKEEKRYVDIAIISNSDTSKGSWHWYTIGELTEAGSLHYSEEKVIILIGEKIRGLNHLEKRELILAL